MKKILPILFSFFCVYNTFSQSTGTFNFDPVAPPSTECGSSCGSFPINILGTPFIFSNSAGEGDGVFFRYCSAVNCAIGYNGNGSMSATSRGGNNRSTIEQFTMGRQDGESFLMKSIYVGTAGASYDASGNVFSITMALYLNGSLVSNSLMNYEGGLAEWNGVDGYTCDEVRFTAQTFTGFSFDHITVGGLPAPTPEITAQGNNISITEGSIEVSAANNTDFGSQNICSGSVVKTFTIRNTGFGTLNVSSINISGSAAADYNVTAAPSGTVAASGTTTFEVTFTPSASGVRDATITIENDDADEASYDFAISGTGISMETPTITAGSTTTFCAGGSVTLASSVSSGNQWYKDGNTISSATNQTYDATASGDYTVIVTETGCSSLASEAITVMVNSKSIITVGNGIAVCNNSGLVNLTTINATPAGGTWSGTGVSGVMFDPSAGTQTPIYTYTDHNGCSNSGEVTITVNPVPATPAITYSGSTTFCAGGSVTLTSSASSGNQWYKEGNEISGATNQTYSATESGDYSVIVTATGCPSPASTATTITVTDPDIDLQGNNTSVINGDDTPSAADHTDFGSQSVASGSIIRTFIIRNTGTTSLNISAVIISGTAAADYTITDQPSSTVATGGTTFFQVTFDPSAPGVRNATITINSDDCDEPAFYFAIAGTGFSPADITFSSPSSKTYGDADFEVVATSDSPEPVSVSSDNTSVATVSQTNNKWYVHITGAGEVKLIASQPAGTSYDAGSAEAILTIDKAILMVTANPITKVYGGNDPALTYSATGFVNNENSNIITGNLIRAGGENAGDYDININTLNAGANYSVSYTGSKFTITKAPQEITWQQVLSAGCNGTMPIQLSATAGSGLPVTYTVANNNIATVNGSTLTPVNQGITTISAIQAGDDNHFAAVEVMKTFYNQPDGLVKQHWNDALLFVNDSSNYVSWQWYKNDNPVSGATKPYYSEATALIGTYYVLATDKNGNTLRTCPLVLTGSSTVINHVKVFPNPASAATMVTVTCDYTPDELRGANLVITDLLGNVLRKVTTVQPAMRVIMPATNGLFVITLQLSNENKETVNVLVR